MKVDIQAVKAAVMVMREADTGPKSGNNTFSLVEAHMHRHGRPALGQPSLNWNATDKYTKLLSFEMDITNILQIKRCALTAEEKVPIIKNWQRREGFQ